eukprot:768800-Hanusia_phi.AAC.10
MPPPPPPSVPAGCSTLSGGTKYTCRANIQRILALHVCPRTNTLSLCPRHSIPAASRPAHLDPCSCKSRATYLACQARQGWFKGEH